MGWYRSWRARNPWGFVVNSGRMSSLGSSGAVFAGKYSREELERYRSATGIGNASRGRMIN